MLKWRKTKKNKEVKNKEPKQKRLKIKIQKINLKKKSAQLYTKGCAFYQRYKDKVTKSIRLEILVMVIIALSISGIVGVVVSSIMKSMGIGEWRDIQFISHQNYLQEQLTHAVDELNRMDYVTIKLNTNEGWLEDILKEDKGPEALEYYLTTNILVENAEGYHTNDVYGELIERFRNSKVTVYDLYDQLMELYKTDGWNIDKAKKLIEEILEKQGLGTVASFIKENYTNHILQQLNRGFFFTNEILVYLLDGEGNNLYTEGIVKKINIAKTIKEISTMNRNNSHIEFIYPVILNEEVHYLYAEADLEGEERTYYTGTADMIGLLVAGVVFIFIIIKGTAKKIRYIEYLSECLHEISKGDLDYHIEIEGQDQLAQVAKDIDYMEHQIKSQIDERMQAEKTKNDLITNVAHDLRTPLTSIIGYMALVKDKKYTTEEEAQKYLEIAYGKSEKLKVLMEDLFEYTKLSNGAVELKRDKISIITLINQLIDELSPLAEERNIQIKTYIKADDTSVFVDMMKMTRVFENMIENAIKYSDEGSIVQVIVQSRDNAIYTTVRNKVVDMLEDDMEKLFERFYRTDTSRNSKTGGSGLGLAIAKSIVDMHGGKIWAQLDSDILSINVKIKR